jgi:hypothetical protein
MGTDAVLIRGAKLVYIAEAILDIFLIKSSFK